MRLRERPRKIPEKLGNALCGVWPYVLALALNTCAHAYLCLRHAQRLQDLLRLAFSFLFFIYPLHFVADLLWSLRPTVCDILAGRLQINRKYYMNVPRREVLRSALPGLTVSVPVYLEDNAVIFATLRDSLAALRRYRAYCGREGNVLVSDDGLACLLGGRVTRGRAEQLLGRSAEDSAALSAEERKAAERIAFYRAEGISFVARPAAGRAGLFKKSSNLNYSLRLGRALGEGCSLGELTAEEGAFAGGYAEGRIAFHEIILLLDKDSGVHERIAEAILPEFVYDKKLAYVQCATNATNLGENYHSRATGQQINNLFHNIWPCKALQGYFVPLVGHNVFLRKAALEESGLWAENRVSEDFDKAIGLYALGFHGKYAQIRGLEFTEYASRSFVEETGKQRRYAYGLFEMIFDGTLSWGRTRGCDIFYMLLYFFSTVNQVMLLPSVLLECFLGNVHLLWAGFLLCNFCFIALSLLRAALMRRRFPGLRTDGAAELLIVAFSFIGHSYSMLAGACRYLANKVRTLGSPFPSTSVDPLRYGFADGLRLLIKYLQKNRFFLVVAILCLDRGIFMLTRKGIETATVVTYCCILFGVVLVPIVLTPQLFGKAGHKALAAQTGEGWNMASEAGSRKRSARRGHPASAPPAGRAAELPTAPRLLDAPPGPRADAGESTSFQDFYRDALRTLLAEEGVPERLRAAYHFESCLRRDEGGQKALYLLRRKSDGVQAILRVTRDYPQEDALEEARLLEGLDHPGIPKAYVAFEEGGRAYVVREYVEGRSLYEIVAAGGALGVADILDLIRRVAEILSYLHAQSPPVIHRDIKPQNIIVGRDGAVYLIDFGIARVHKDERSQDTSVVLTLDYAPPEQFGFEQTTPLSDIYSLGVVALFMATERTERTGLEARIVNNRLRGLIERCVAFNPRARFQSADELLSYLGCEAEITLRRRGRGLRRAAAIALGLALACGASFGAAYLGERARARALAFTQAQAVGYVDGYEDAPVFSSFASASGAGRAEGDEARGNSPGNAALAGGAFVAQGEGLIFYILDGDICRMNAQGGEQRLFVADAEAGGLSFVNGWVYHRSGEELLQTNLYTEQSDLLYSGAEACLYTLEGRFYVLDAEGLVRLFLPGRELRPLIDSGGISELNIGGGYIYFCAADGRARRLAADGEGAALLLADAPCLSLCLFGEDLYGTLELDGSPCLVRMARKGEAEPVKLAEVDARMLNVTEEGIFYLDAGESTVFLASPDGRIRRRITGNRALDFNVAGQWVFYHNADDGGRLWCVRSDGVDDHPLRTLR